MMSANLPTLLFLCLGPVSGRGKGKIYVLHKISAGILIIVTLVPLVEGACWKSSNIFYLYVALDCSQPFIGCLYTYFILLFFKKR